MNVRRHSEAYNFLGDTTTGVTMRWGTDIKSSPYFAPWPELADISISNHCSKGCEFCYRDSKADQSFMTVAQYEKVLDELSSSKWGSVFQVALGGGEPLEHPDFIKIIEKTNERGIAANFTTNGANLNESVVNSLKGKIGAVAISTNKIEELPLDKLSLLIKGGIKTNIHFVLDNKSIYEAIGILEGKYNDILKDINGVIFLTYKPRGRASTENCLTINSELERFIELTDNSKCITRIGFDACFVPLLMKYTEVDVDYIDSCECGFFSVYIDEKMNVKPCSFANDDRFSYSLEKYTMDEIWNEKYESYRKDIMINNCNNECSNKSNCRGKCAYYECLTFCYQ
jgi:MoaA/NifB/PqqE/SkfB family radical SAM enzyme